MSDFLMEEVQWKHVMHIRTVSGIGITLLSLLIALLQFCATRNFWYWEYWWFDIVMHFLGGLFVVGSYLWLVRFEAPRIIAKHIPLFLSAFVVVLVIGVAWELFEYGTGMYNAVNYTLDTTLDLFTDGAGMLFAYFIFKRYVI